MRITIEFHRPSFARRRTIAVLLVALLAIPGVALASHQFTDVPTGHLFHDDIAKAYGARLTTGCTATTFCPDGNVTRGQMTAFLNRGLGRAARGGIGGVVTSSTPTLYGSVTVRAGNPTGGTALALINVNVLAEATATTGCPCEYFVGIRQGGVVHAGTYIDLTNATMVDPFANGSAPLQALLPVPTGVERTFEVWVHRNYGTAAASIGGSITALVVPFDGLGGNPSLMGGAAAPEAVDTHAP